MSKVARSHRLDPIAAAAQFKADLAAMAAGQSGRGTPQRRMHTKNFGLVQYKFNRWSAELDEDQTLDDALDPKFWVEQAAQIMGFNKLAPKGRGDIIELRKLDTGLYAELVVREIGPGFVKVDLVSSSEPELVAVPESAPLKTRWNVGRLAHEVIRDDGQVMAGDFQTKASAVAWIADHIKKMSRADAA